MRCACAAAPLLILAACGQGNSDNVMAPNANALPPSLVDLALGPEIANATGNEADPGNAASPAAPIGADAPAAAPRTSNKVDSEPIEGPADATAEEEAAANSTLEE